MAVVGDYVDFQNGYAFKSKDFCENGDYNVIKIKELKDGKIKITSDTAMVKYMKDIEKYVVDDGDILFALTGDPISKPNPLSWVGRVSMYRGKESAVINQRVCKVIPKYGLNPLYLYYFFRNNSEFYQLAAKATGSASQANISTKTISDTYINLPNIEYQNKVVGFLSSLDEKIEINNKINDNLQEQARTLYKAWFVDFEPFDGARPDNWKTGKLKDVLTLKRNAIKAGDNTVLPYLPIDVIPMNTFALSDVKPNSEAQSSLITFDKDDIVIGAMRVYFHRVIIAPFNGITRTTCFVLSPINEEYLSYGLLCCDQDSSIEYAQTTSKGSTMPYAVWDGGLGDMEITIPDKDSAQRFNEAVLPMIRMIQSSYDENIRLKKLRDTLLPMLMSGELDISDIDL